MQKFTYLLALFFIAGCQKNHETPPDAEKPVIVVSSPTASQVISAAQPVTISAHITDNSKVEEVHLEIINTVTNVTFTHEHFAPGSASYDLLRTITLPSAGNYKIRIEAEDTLRNDSEVEITITAN